MSLKLSAKIYLWAVFILAAICTVIYLPRIELSRHFISTLLFLAVIAFFSEVYEIEITYKRSISASIAIYLAAVYLGGASLAIPAVLLGTLIAEIILRWEFIKKGVSSFLYRVGFNVSQTLLSATIAAVVFEVSGGHAPPYATPVEFGPPVAAFFTYILVNTALVSGIIHLTEKVSFLYHLKFNLQHLSIQFLSLGVLSILLAIVYQIQPWYILLVLVPLVLVHVSLRGYMRLRHQAQKTFEKVAQSLGERDPYTGKHSEDVAVIARKIGRELGLAEDEVEQIEAAARVHDIGKISIPDSVLLKPGKLTDEEWEAIKQHPVIGADLLSGLEIYEGSIDIIRHHHEHWDGSGYPDGLKGEQIPLGARIVAVADVYNALTTDRPYRKAYSKAEALEIIRDMSGKELDPQLVEIFLRVI
ncbi:HD domain-containing protein [Candidatus Bipolaricaulota bacterium]|nr:HD domain-containing protein [Candidatus Bipolaricaulota bacterium]